MGNLKIGTRIYAGFGMLLAAIIFMAVQTNLELEKLGGEFNEYGDMASGALLVADIETAMKGAQLAAREYMISSSKEKKHEFDVVHDQLVNLVAKAKKTIHKPERAELIKKIEEELHEYDAGFAKIITLLEKRHELVSGTLDPMGKDIRVKLTEIREGAYAAGDMESASYAGIAQEDLLLARLYVRKFLDANEEAAVKRATDEFIELEHALENLGKSLENPARLALLEKINAELVSYEKAFAELVDVVHERNKISSEVLDYDAKLMIENAEKIKASAHKDEAALRATVAEEIKNAEIAGVAVASGALVLGIICAFFIGRGITRPVMGLTSAMQKLAEGDNSIDIPGLGRGDEVGAMAQTVGIFKQNAIDKVRLEAESAAEQEAREKRTELMGVLIEKFEGKIGDVLAEVGTAVQSLESTSQGMLATAEQTKSQATAAAAASEEASTNASTVASAAEEMSSTITEVSGQVTKTSEVAKEAKAQAETTNERVGELAEAAQKIGDVVNLISEIAEQTNLLALNATIEAARAGEAGKGFAVVASEVKELASQTAKATEEIGSQITGIQNVTSEAVTAVQGISETIESVNSISASVAAAMEEQQSATEEIARSIQQAALGTTEVAVNITGVSQAADESTNSAAKLIEASKQLGVQSDTMQKEIESFLTDVRAA